MKMLCSLSGYECLQSSGGEQAGAVPLSACAGVAAPAATTAKATIAPRKTRRRGFVNFMVDSNQR